MRTALVVDDSMLIRHTVSRFLEQRGWVVECAANGQEALEILTQFRPGLIITDLQMPQMSGPELITALQADPQLRHIPVLVLAGRQLSDTVVETRAAAVIQKDIDIEAQLDRAIHALSV